MPSFPIHGFGVPRAMEGLNQWGQRVRDKEQSVMQMFLQQAGQGVLPDDAFSEGNPAWGQVQKQFGGLAPGIQQMNKQAAEMKKMQLDEAKQEIENRKYQRQMQALTTFDKTMDSAVKLRKTGNAKVADALLRNASQLYKQVTGIDLELGAHMDDKQINTAVQRAEMGRIEQMLEAAKAGNPKVLPTLTLAVQQFGEDYGVDLSLLVKEAADSALKPQKEPKELSPRDQAFQRLTPAEQRQALLGREPQPPQPTGELTDAQAVETIRNLFTEPEQSVKFIREYFEAKNKGKKRGDALTEVLGKMKPGGATAGGELKPWENPEAFGIK